MLAIDSKRHQSSTQLKISASDWHPRERKIIHRDPQSGEVIMPPLFCPFAWAEHEEGEAVTDGLWQWLDRFTGPESIRVRHAMKRHGIDAFAQRVFPCSSLKVARLHAAYSGFLYTFDDTVVDNPSLEAEAVLERIHDTLAVLDGRSPALSGVTSAPGVLDIIDEVARIDARVAARLHRHTRRYLLGCQWERLSRETPPSLATYMRIRRDASAVFPCFDFSLLDFAREGSIEALDGPLVNALETMANNVIAWSNDIVGMSREVSAGIENLVTVLRRERQLDWQSAVNAAADMCNAEMREFVAMRENIDAFCGAELQPYRAELDGYLDVMSAWMSGSISWHLESRRFSSHKEERIS
jgi:Terpene synthase family 2, C-terminal metal binding